MSDPNALRPDHPAVLNGLLVLLPDQETYGLWVGGNDEDHLFAIIQQKAHFSVRRAPSVQIDDCELMDEEPGELVRFLLEDVAKVTPRRAA